MNEERLGEVGLDSDHLWPNSVHDTHGSLVKGSHLVVDVVIVSVVAREPLERIKRQRVSTVVVDGFEGCNREQKCSLTE